MYFQSARKVHFSVVQWPHSSWMKFCIVHNRKSAFFSLRNRLIVFIPTADAVSVEFMLEPSVIPVRPSDDAPRENRLEILLQCESRLCLTSIRRWPEPSAEEINENFFWWKIPSIYFNFPISHFIHHSSSARLHISPPCGAQHKALCTHGRARNRIHYACILFVCPRLMRILEGNLLKWKILVVFFSLLLLVSQLTNCRINIYASMWSWKMVLFIRDGGRVR